MKRRRATAIGVLLAGALLALYIAEPGMVRRPLLGTLLQRATQRAPMAGSTFAPQMVAEARRRHQRGKAWSQWYLARKDNVFASPQTARQDVAAAGLPLIDDLETFLSDTHELTALKKDTPMLRQHPPVVLERMAAIDILELLATAENLDPGAPMEPLVERAQDVLAQRVVATPSERDAAVVRAVLRAEQHDALLALIHVNSRRGLEVYGGLNVRTARFLQSAVMLALIDLGMPESEALRTAQEARP